MTYDIFDFVDYLQDILVGGGDIAKAFAQIVETKHLSKLEELIISHSDRIDIADYLVMNHLYE